MGARGKGGFSEGGCMRDGVRGVRDGVRGVWMWEGITVNAIYLSDIELHTFFPGSGAQKWYLVHGKVNLQILNLQHGFTVSYGALFFILFFSIGGWVSSEIIEAP